MLYPTIRALFISLHEWNIAPAAASPFVGVDNYVNAVRDPVFWRSFQNGGIYMLITVPLQIGLGLAAALLLDAKLRGRTLFRTLIYIPVVTSWVVSSLLFRYLFGAATGPINTILTDVTGILSEPVAWLGSRWTALIAICSLGIWKGIGWAMLIFLAALQAVPQELHEAAAVDGAGGGQRLRHVTLPSIRRTVTLVAVLSIIGGFNVFISVHLMTGGGPADQTQVPITYLYRQAFSFLDFGYGSAISFLMTVLVFAVAISQLWLSSRAPSEGPA
jgi:multiple sugar transport system permease protein